MNSLRHLKNGFFSLKIGLIAKVVGISSGGEISVECEPESPSLWGPSSQRSNRICVKICEFASTNDDADATQNPVQFY